jgi:4-amino-4-deoxy-L-arabinose transferase-like glycosyltransferase
MVPALALGSYFIGEGQWKSIFKWQWILLLAMIGTFISPFLYGLYLQYDLQPGKVINGMVIDSGIKFYLWTQSFGRLTGENAWKDNSGPFFFTHTFLWSFLPWSILYVLGLIHQVRCLFSRSMRSVGSQEWLTIGGVVLPFIAFSLSKYKLPHYIYVIFPLMAITASRFAVAMLEFEFSRGSFWRQFTAWSFTLLLAGIPVVIFLLCYFSFPGMSVLLWVLFIVGFILIWYKFLLTKGFNRSFLFPVFYTILLANLLLNLHIYPNLLRYQSYSQVSKEVRRLGIPDSTFFSYTESLHSIDFYAQRIVPDLLSFREVDSISTLRPIYLYTNTDRLQELITLPTFHVEVVKTYEHFHVTTLTLEFLAPISRPETLRKRYLLKISRKHV